MTARRAPRFDLEALRQAVTVADVLAAEGIEPPRRGGRLPCPIRGGDNPTAFAIRDEGRRFCCFACGAHGDVFDLVQALRGCHKVAAFSRVAELAGGAAFGPRHTARRKPPAEVHRARARVLERLQRERFGAAIAERTTLRRRARQAGAGLRGPRDQQDSRTPPWEHLQRAVIALEYAERDVAELEAENYRPTDLREAAAEWLAEQHSDLRPRGGARS